MPKIIYQNAEIKMSIINSTSSLLKLNIYDKKTILKNFFETSKLPLKIFLFDGNNNTKDNFINIDNCKQLERIKNNFSDKTVFCSKSSNTFNV